jgi:multidrug efflux pump subunit AcrA (membrane-fusion protein)
MMRFSRSELLWSVCLAGLVLGTQLELTLPALVRAAEPPAEVISLDSVLISVIDSAEVPARDVGLLTEILVREGDEVSRGELLIKLDAAEAELAVKLARSEHEMAELEAKNRLREQYALKAAEVAQAEHERAVQANRKYPETVSKTEIERLHLLQQRAVLDFQQAEQEHKLRGMQADLKHLAVQQAELSLERRLIKAPLSGIVVRIEHRIGEWVQPGMPLLKLIDTRTLRAEAVIPGRYRHLSFHQAPVLVRVPGHAANSTEVAGRVSFVHPEIDPVDGSFRIWAELDNADQRLRPGDSVQMTIQPTAVTATTENE